MRFSKWHGLGNDYLLVERADGAPLGAAAVRRLCDYHRGIGADGLLEVVSAQKARAEIVIWNPDGSTAELSGNGTRIAARWLARRSGCERVEIHAGTRTVSAVMRGGLQVEQDLGVVEVGPPELLAVGGEQLEIVPVSVGNPHAVVERPLRREDLLRLGPLVEHHERFPDRTNVQLVHVDAPHEISVLVWERGVGETLASGTSACAAAAAMLHLGRCRNPVVVHLPGGDLHVEVDDAGRALLVGPAQEICSGEVAQELLAELQTATP